ncbi:hypothetical protein D3C80_2173660 [compost metagenome]
MAARVVWGGLFWPIAGLFNLIVAQQQGIPLLEAIGAVSRVAGDADMGLIPQQE